MAGIHYGIEAGILAAADAIPMYAFATSGCVFVAIVCNSMFRSLKDPSDADKRQEESWKEWFP